MVLTKLYILILVLSLCWGLWPGLTGDTVYMASGDFEIYTSGVVMIAVFAAIFSKYIASVTASVYCEAFAKTYFIAAIVKFATISDYDFVYMISDTYFDILIYISFTLAIMDARKPVHS